MLLYPMSKVNKKNDINNFLINFIWSDIKKDIRSYPGANVLYNILVKKAYFFNQLLENLQFRYSPLTETKVFWIAPLIHFCIASNCFSFSAKSLIRI